MGMQIGKKFNPVPGYTLLLDGTLPESYPGTGSTWIDLSSRGNSAGLGGSPTFTRISTGASALTFNGTNQYGALGELGLSRSFTISTWIRRANTSSTGWILGAGWVATTGDGAGLGVALGFQGSTLALTTWGNGGYVSYGGLGAGQWYHVVATQTAGPTASSSGWNAVIYVNGAEVSTGGFYNYHYYSTGGAATSYLARNSHSSIDSYNYFAGDIGQILVYNSTTLTATQVREAFQQTRSRYGV